MGERLETIKQDFKRLGVLAIMHLEEIAKHDEQLAIELMYTMPTKIGAPFPFMGKVCLRNAWDSESRIGMLAFHGAIYLYTFTVWSSFREDILDQISNVRSNPTQMYHSREDNAEAALLLIYIARSCDQSVYQEVLEVAREYIPENVLSEAIKEFNVRAAVDKMRDMMGDLVE